MPKGPGTYGNTKGRPPAQMASAKKSPLKDEITNRETKKSPMNSKVKNV